MEVLNNEIETKPCTIQNVSCSGICPDYDEDCKTMSVARAEWCFMGCQGHECNPDPNSSLGTAKGTCPIIHHCN
ncbi:MAG: hypothetical protein GY834_03560 [Bacteroidetes bacterium]|nr:hypothetical protein [Bacteroidota bacterium]